MNFPNYFADAESSFNDAEFVIFGVPYDKTSSFRHGASKAPVEIRQSSWNFETYNIQTGVDLRDIKFHDYGDLNVSNNDPPAIMIEKVRDFVFKLIKKNKFPIMLGGEHSATVGAIQAFSDDIAVLFLDAHMDFRDRYENEQFNHACVIKRVAEYLDVGNIVIAGVRSAEKEEFEDAKSKNLFYLDAFSIFDKGIEKTLKDIKNYLNGKKVYLSLDIDVLDPSYAPGTSTPEPFGLTSLDVMKFIEFFASQLIGFDIVEVCPPFDNGETSLLSAKYVRYIVEHVWSSNSNNNKI